MTEDAAKAQLERLRADGLMISVAGQALQPGSREYERMLKQLMGQLSAEELAELLHEKLRLSLRASLLDQMRAEAKDAEPNECCGLIEGVSVAGGWRVTAIHEARNVAEDPQRGFLVDPKTHFHFLRTLRNTGREIIGCYHSHPRGTPAPSQRDRAEALEDKFLWLIASGDEIRAFAFEAATRSFSAVSIVLKNRS